VLENADPFECKHLRRLFTKVNNVYPNISMVYFTTTVSHVQKFYRRSKNSFEKSVQRVDNWIYKNYTKNTGRYGGYDYDDHFTKLLKIRI